MVAAGNRNEQHFLLPLVDELISQGLRPVEVWADRGYYAARLREGLCERRITPCISRRRDPGEPIAPGSVTYEHHRGRKKTRKARDLMGRHRWPIERTNAWIHVLRRLHIRREVKAENYTALLTIGLCLILARNY
jgi:transposase